MKCVIDNLDVPLVFDIFKLVRRQTHNSRAFLAVKIYKYGFRDVGQLGREHICWHAVLIGFIAIRAAPADALLDDFSFAVIVGAREVVSLVIIFKYPNVRTDKIVLIGYGLEDRGLLLTFLHLVKDLSNQPLVFKSLMVVLLLFFEFIRLAIASRTR